MPARQEQHLITARCAPAAAHAQCTIALNALLQLVYEYVGVNYTVPEVQAPGSFPACSQAAVKSLNLNKPCPAGTNKVGAAASGWLCRMAWRLAPPAASLREWAEWAEWLSDMSAGACHASGPRLAWSPTHGRLLGCLQENCGFDGVWRPVRPVTAGGMPIVYATSSFFYTTAGIGLIPFNATKELVVTPQVGGWVLRGGGIARCVLWAAIARSRQPAACAG
jgi:hypothetical protein